MALVYKDRVLETSTTTGTGTYTLAGAVTGYQAFTAIGNANTCYYGVFEVDANGNPNGGWETGVGTYTLSGTTLARTTVLDSSNAGAAVNWSAGTRRVMCSQTAAAMTDFNRATSLILPTAAGAAPTTNADLRFDSTLKAFVGGEDGKTVVLERVLNAQTGGDTNDSASGSGSDYDHTLSFALPSAFLNKVGRVLRVTQLWQTISGSAMPQYNIKLKIGGTIVSAMVTNQNGVNNLSSPGRYAPVEFFIVVLTTGATGTIAVGQGGTSQSVGGNAVTTNGIAQPITLDLTSALTIAHASQWGTAGTGTNTLTLVAAIVEVLR